LIVKTSAPNCRSWIALLRNHDADQEAHQPDNAQRVDADDFELAHHCVPANAPRMPHQREQIDQHRAEKADQTHQCDRGADRRFAHAREHALERWHRRRHIAQWLIGSGDLFEQMGLILVRAIDRNVMIACDAMDQPGADRVHPLHRREIDSIGRGFELVELLRQLAELGEGERTREAQRLGIVRQFEVGRCAHARDTIGDAGKRNWLGGGIAALRRLRLRNVPFPLVANPRIGCGGRR